jgi:hypothetical protein
MAWRAIDALSAMAVAEARAADARRRSGKMRGSLDGVPVFAKAIDAPGIHGFWGDPRYFPEARRQALEFFRRHLRVAE